MIVDPRNAGKRGPAVLRVRSRRHGVLTRRVDHVPGSEHAPLSAQDMRLLLVKAREAKEYLTFHGEARITARLSSGEFVDLVLDTPEGFAKRAAESLAAAMAMDPKLVTPPVIEAHCDYHRPARYDDELDVRTEGRMLSPVRMEFTYQVVRREDQVVAASGRRVSLHDDVAVIQTAKDAIGDLAKLLEADAGGVDAPQDELSENRVRPA